MGNNCHSTVMGLGTNEEVIPPTPHESPESAFFGKFNHLWHFEQSIGKIENRQVVDFFIISALIKIFVLTRHFQHLNISQKIKIKKWQACFFFFGVGIFWNVYLVSAYSVRILNISQQNVKIARLFLSFFHFFCWTKIFFIELVILTYIYPFPTPTELATLRNGLTR